MNRITTFKEYISSITILTSGTAYSEPPQLFIDAPTRTHDTSDNTQAVATLSIDGGGAISAVTITNDGDGYIVAPTPYVVGFPTELTVTSDASTEHDEGSYPNIPTTTNSANGTGLTVNVAVSSTGVVTLTVSDDGNATYREADTISINPVDIGGQATDPTITATITKINNGSGATFSSTLDKVAKGDQYVQPKISTLVPNQLPESIQEDFPLFKTLIEKYYQFMEQTNTTDNTKHGPLKVLQDFLAKLDVDFNDDGSIVTDDNFLIEFFRDYAKDFPQTQTAKLSRVIKDINNFYTAKGSPKAIEYLFQVLYNENVTVTNSEKFVLRPSSNTWNQDLVVKCYSGLDSSVEPSSLGGQRVDLHYAVSEGAVTNYFKKTATVERATKIAYTNPQAYELVLDLPATFVLPGPGNGNAGRDEQLHAYVRGTIATITGTGSSGAFENPTSTVVDGTYVVSSSDYTSYLDVPYTNNTVLPVGTYVKANNKIYVTINEGTTNSSGSGPTHEHGEQLDGTSKMRYISSASHKTTGSSNAAFSVVISGNAISSVTVSNAGTGVFLNEIFEVPASHFGGSGTPAVKFKVGSIANGEIGDILILDGGAGFSANPSIDVNPDTTDTISTTAVIDTRLTDGAISDTVFVANQRGVGYNKPPSLVVDVASVLTYITTEGGTANIINSVAIPTRGLTSAAFTSIKTGSSTTDGGFKVGDTFKVAESGDVLGVYAIDYFSEDYTLTGISNNGFIKVAAVGTDGYPTKFDILAVGVGYLRGEFTFEITSSTGEICTITLKTGYSSLLAGVFKDAGSFLSDANRVFDNRIYQNFSYQIETERPQSEWNDYVRRAAHPVGFGVFGNLQVKQSVDMSSNFTVETDVYMFFKYPDIEEILIQDAVAKDVGKPVSDSIFPGEGLANRAGGLSFLNIEQVKTDNAGIGDSFGPYTAQGTEVLNIYATSDGLPSGDPYFFVHADENDDYVERNVIGDYFLEDYVLFGNPRKDVTLDFTIVESGEYATDYFAHDAGRYTFLFAETTAEIYRIDDQITSLAVEMTATTDTVDWAETVLISFVFFRNPADTFDMADAAVLEPGVRPTDTPTLADAISKFDVETNPTDTGAMQDTTAFDVTTTAADSSGVADAPALESHKPSIADTMNMADAPSIEPQIPRTDTMSMADAINKLDIGVLPSDTPALADAVNKFDITTVATDTMNMADAVSRLDVESAASDTSDVADTGNLISQSYTVDLTYFAEDYVADTVINF